MFLQGARVQGIAEGVIVSGQLPALDRRLQLPDLAFAWLWPEGYVYGGEDEKTEIAAIRYLVLVLVSYVLCCCFRAGRERFRMAFEWKRSWRNALIIGSADKSELSGESEGRVDVSHRRQ